MRGGQDRSPNQSDIFVVFWRLRIVFEDHLCYPTSDTVKEGTYLHQTSIIKKTKSSNIYIDKHTFHPYLIDNFGTSGSAHM